MERSAITQTLPIIPLRGRVVYPDTVVSLDIGRDISVKAAERSASCDMNVFLCAQRTAEKMLVKEDDIYSVGTVARIRSVTLLPNGNKRLVVEGLYRGEARNINFENGYFYAVVDEILTFHSDDILEEAYFRAAKALVKDIRQQEGRIAKEVIALLDECTDIDKYINICANSMRLRDDIKQQLLAEAHLIERLKLFERCLNDELEIAKIEKKVAQNVRKSIDENQKEYYLREQLKAIHTELGDDVNEQEEFRNKILDKGMPEEIEEKALKELARMDKMQPSSPESTVIRTYLEWLIDLPWTEETTDTEKLSDCVKVLNEDHYGLEKIKERITEYLAVLKLTGTMKAPILCFVGPPGVGKTSIATSIARALGRKFVRMSLGGVKDEAEIRGHRRTYIGAMPGRIMYGLKEAGTINPVFLLDEIDKVSTDMRGDPASALLEVLDPEQNATFRDRFIEEPYDLSKVLFITTANSLDTIPAPLLDRMEVISLTGYTQDEKREIAKGYLVPKKTKENGLTEKNIQFTDEGIDKIVENYTREAGVRNLEREIGSVCRKVAVVYADHKRMKKRVITAAEVSALLGPEKYQKGDEMMAENEVGACTGLAWTAVGGTTLTIEVSTMKGKGEVKLTGHLGDVMRESALAALTFIRSHADEYSIPYETFGETDIHIHVPEGATPKDGPSAGITMATAILSALTRKPVRRDIAMTGEITLRGKVLPIGGLKEKSLAAHRIGIKNIIIPKDNLRDTEEIPENIRKDLNFIPADNVATVFHNAILQS